MIVENRYTYRSPPIVLLDLYRDLLPPERRRSSYGARAVRCFLILRRSVIRR